MSRRYTCLHVSLTVNHGKSLKNAIIEAKSGKPQIDYHVDDSNDGEEEEQVKLDSLFRVIVDGKEIPRINEDSCYNYNLVYSYPSRGKISVKAVDAYDGTAWTGESKEFTFDIKNKRNFGGYGANTLMVDGLENQVYTGSPIILDLDVYYAEENELHYYERYPDSLVEGKDYTVAYSNNINVGTATVTLTGIGNYKGTITKEFNITHNKINKVNSKKATCTTGGNKTYWTCATCKKVFSDSKATKETTLAAVAIEKLGHKYGEWTKLNSTQHQRVCKTDKSHVQKKNHTWDKGKVTKKATETATGVKTYTCTECKATKKETIPKLEAKVQKNIRRAYGESRYETAFAIADAYLVDSGKVKSYSDISGTKRKQTLDAIVVACGTNFPDALAASYFASSKKAPVILWREKDNAKVQEYIKANLKPGKRVYIMGGTGAVGSSIAKGLSGYKFTRLGGENRYETNIKILKAAGVKGGEILVCDGTNFENALISSASGKPILLVKPNGVTREGINFVAGLKNPTFTIVGGEKSVAAFAVTQLKKYGKVTRITGSNPDQVSVNVAKKYFKNPKEIIVATSNTFADALCGGVLAIKNKSPILLVTDSQNSKSIAYAKALAGLEKVTALGGTVVVSDALSKKELNVGNKKVNAQEYYRTVDKNKRGELKVRSGKV